MAWVACCILQAASTKSRCVICMNASLIVGRMIRVILDHVSRQFMQQFFVETTRNGKPETIFVEYFSIPDGSVLYARACVLLPTRKPSCEAALFATSRNVPWQWTVSQSNNDGRNCRKYQISAHRQMYESLYECVRNVPDMRSCEYESLGNRLM